jgi:hypothetical protein
MRLPIAPLFGLLLGTLVEAAESPYERDMNQLKEQRDKAVAAATIPINRRYKESLEDLLRRATQANDLDAANKIKDEMKQLGFDTAATATSVSSTPNFVDKLTKQAWTWTSHPGGRDRVEFSKTGDVTHNGWQGAKWVAKPGNTVVITMGSTQATLKFNEAMTAFEGVDFGSAHPVKGEHF